mmetsp:Transcript_48428/g.134236  ORF Transcript_48428/g.134236 Transcript_48428/m.134236 type:complete len:300 (-) Transcript_48428:110-1009(-)
MRRRRRLLLLLAVEGAGLCAGDRFVRRGRRPRARAGAGRLRRRVRQHHQREDRRPRQRHAARARQRRGLEGGHRGGGRLGAAGQPRRRLLIPPVPPRLDARRGVLQPAPSQDGRRVDAAVGRRWRAHARLRCGQRDDGHQGGRHVAQEPRAARLEDQDGRVGPGLQPPADRLGLPALLRRRGDGPAGHRAIVHGHVGAVQPGDCGQGRRAERPPARQVGAQLADGPGGEQPDLAVVRRPCRRRLSRGGVEAHCEHRKEKRRSGKIQLRADNGGKSGPRWAQPRATRTCITISHFVAVRA